MLLKEEKLSQSNHANNNEWDTNDKMKSLYVINQSKIDTKLGVKWKYNITKSIILNINLNVSAYTNTHIF